MDGVPLDLRLTEHADARAVSALLVMLADWRRSCEDYAVNVRLYGYLGDDVDRKHAMCSWVLLRRLLGRDPSPGEFEILTDRRLPRGDV